MRLFNTQLFHPGEPEIDTDTVWPDPIERPRYGNHLWTRQAQAFARKYGHRQTQPASGDVCAAACCS